MALSELTPREGDVLRLAAGGLSNEQIATRLEISRRTVEAHMRMLFRKTGAERRSQLALLWTRTMVGEAGSETSETSETAPAAGDDDNDDGSAVAAAQVLRSALTDCTRRSRQLTEVLTSLVDRQFPLFEERVELTVLVGDRSEEDAVIERRWTRPQPYVVYRMLRPIVSWDDPPPRRPSDLAANCEVYGLDTQVTVQTVWDDPDRPLAVVLFQPGIGSETEWLLRYRSPNLWNVLRNTGEDTLDWATATLDGRIRPNVSEVVLNVDFPPGWDEAGLTEENDLGLMAAVTPFAGGRSRFTWRSTAPVAAVYRWHLHGRPGRK